MRGRDKMKKENAVTVLISCILIIVNLSACSGKSDGLSTSNHVSTVSSVSSNISSISSISNSDSASSDVANDSKTQGDNTQSAVNAADARTTFGVKPQAASMALFTTENVTLNINKISKEENYYDGQHTVVFGGDTIYEMTYYSPINSYYVYVDIFTNKNDDVWNIVERVNIKTQLDELAFEDVAKRIIQITDPFLKNDADGELSRLKAMDGTTVDFKDGLVSYALSSSDDLGGSVTKTFEATSQH
jgi:L-rhamnose mutarotase